MGWNDMVIEQFREGRERVADTFNRDSLLLLHTTGARSGEPRVSPLTYLDRDDHLLVVASAAGADRHPAWYHNLLSDPHARVERWAGGLIESLDVVAQPLERGERDRLWPEIVAWGPGFAEYQDKTDRLIPLVALRRTD